MSFGSRGMQWGHGAPHNFGALVVPNSLIPVLLCQAQEPLPCLHPLLIHACFSSLPALHCAMKQIWLAVIAAGSSVENIVWEYKNEFTVLKRQISLIEGLVSHSGHMARGKHWILGDPSSCNLFFNHLCLRGFLNQAWHLCLIPGTHPTLGYMQHPATGFHNLTINWVR